MKMTSDKIMEALKADNSAEQVQQLLDKGLDPTEHFGYDGTALTMAVEWGNLEVVKLLLEHDADPNEYASIWQKPSLWFAVRREDDAMIDFLLKHGAMVPGSGTLHQAALQLNPSLIRLLIQNGGDPLEVEIGDGMPRQDYTPLTALHRAVRPRLGWSLKEQRLDKQPHLDTIRMLIELGVDRHAKTDSGLTALDIARSNPELPRVAELLASYDKMTPTS